MHDKYNISYDSKNKVFKFTYAYFIISLNTKFMSKMNVDKYKVMIDMQYCPI